MLTLVELVPKPYELNSLASLAIYLLHTAQASCWFGEELVVLARGAAIQVKLEVGELVPYSSTSTSQLGTFLILGSPSCGRQLQKRRGKCANCWTSPHPFMGGGSSSNRGGSSSKSSSRSSKGGSSDSGGSSSRSSSSSSSSSSNKGSSSSNQESSSSNQGSSGSSSQSNCNKSRSSKSNNATG